MEKTESSDEFRSEEEKIAALAFNDEKNKANLVYANRTKGPNSSKYDSLGQEILSQVELSGIYKDSSISRKIEKRKTDGLQQVVLFSDIDNTFYDRNNPDASSHLSNMLEKMSWGVVYVTGRDQEMVESQNDLPKADIVVGAVGTEIYILNTEGKYVRDEEFREILLGSWDRDTIYQEAKDIVNRHSDISFQPRDNPDLIGQEGHEPQEFKISLHIFGEIEKAQEVAKLFDQIKGIKVIFSTDIHNPNKFNLDLLPETGGKELAVQYLSNKLGIKGFVAGDSGNDLGMLLDSGHPAILVGGAQEETRAAVVNYQADGLFDRQIRRMPNGQEIRIGTDKIDDASRGIINALQQADFNPEDAKWFVTNLYNMSKKEK